MRDLVFRVIAVLGLITALGAIALVLTSRTQMVYVDSARLINEYKGMQDARKVFQQKSATWKANVDTLVVEVQRSIAKYEREAGKMTVKERQLSQELIRTKQKQLGEYQQAMNSKAQQEDGQMTQQVIEQINGYLKKYGEKHDYTIILAATEYGNIVYAEEGMDITAEVIVGLNQEYTGQ